MRSLTRLLTWRYLTQSTDSSSISSMIYICFTSIFVSAFSLTLVSAIMNGIEHATLEQIQGVNAQIIMRGYDDILNVPAIQHALIEQFPAVAASAPSTVEHAMIQAVAHVSQDTESGSRELRGAPTLALIKAIDPEQEKRVTTLHKTITSFISDKTHTRATDTHNQIPSLANLLEKNQVMLGQDLASMLDITVGDTVEIIHADTQEIRKRTVTFSSTPATVSALFKTGIDDFDSGLVITSFEFLQELFPESGPTQLNLRLNTHNPRQEALLIKQLTETFGFDTMSWRQLYPAIISALTLEKYAMFFILVLIMLVASMNSIALLFMQITQKRADIAILKAMGTPDKTIEQIFVLAGLGITLAATIPGIACGVITSLLIDKYRLITLPDAYYISHLPATISWPTLLAVFCVILVISIGAVYSAARKTRAIRIAHVLRFEG
jgi:lipoprotein-releasing system permease protein